MNGSTNTSIQPSSRVIRNEAIIAAEIDESVVMMDVEKGRYYELDPVGARVWTLAESGPRIAEVCEALVAEYEVAPDTCGGDVRAFLDELRRQEVVRILPGNGAIKMGNTDPRDPEGPARSEKAAPARRGEAGTKPAWTTPTIRVMAIERTAADPQWVKYPHPNELALNKAEYSQES